jgi:predicted transcriptional regulator of viral defense system
VGSLELPSCIQDCFTTERYCTGLGEHFLALLETLDAYTIYIYEFIYA